VDGVVESRLGPNIEPVGPGIVAGRLILDYCSLVSSRPQWPWLGIDIQLEGSLHPWDRDSTVTV
jgi:hypothetical protein